MIGGIDADWNTFARVPILEHVARNAGEIAQQYALRGCDAVHLASALHLHQRFEDLRFLAFDNRLVNAARAAGIPVYTD